MLVSHAGNHPPQTFALLCRPRPSFPALPPPPPPQPPPPPSRRPPPPRPTRSSPQQQRLSLELRRLRSPPPPCPPFQRWAPAVRCAAAPLLQRHQVRVMMMKRDRTSKS